MIMNIENDLHQATSGDPNDSGEVQASITFACAMHNYLQIMFGWKCAIKRN